MKVTETSIGSVKIIEPARFGDSRGWFCETYNEERYRAAGICAAFVQDNESLSRKGVVRGLHWQAGEFCQAKLVRVIRGAVWDVSVDIRKGSPTYGRHVAVVLYSSDSELAKSGAGPSVAVTGANGYFPAPDSQLFIPRGFAHGFVVLEDDTLFSYKCDNFYNKASERGMLFSDPELNISWPATGEPVVLSDKDMKHPLFRDIEPYA